MTADLKGKFFDWGRRSLTAAGIKTANDRALICPLCWQETPYEGLSLEHAVPGSVGGSYTTLTCRRCNNDQGSALDSHVANFQAVADALKGHGTFDVELQVNGKRMAADFEWGEGKKNFHVIAEASNPKEVVAIQQDFRDGKVGDLSFLVSFKYAKNNFDTALLRAAYLVLFKCFGYEYAQHDIVQCIRRRISDMSLEQPRLAPLLIELRNCKLPYDEPHLVVPGNVNGVALFLVIIRLRKETTTWLGVYMPVPGERCGEFFDLMEQASHEHNGESMTLPKEAIFT